MNMRKITSILLCAIFVFTTVFMTEPSIAISYGYSNYGSHEHWAEKYLENLVNQDIMRGDVDGNLRADDNITRAEFVAMINRAFGYKGKAKIAYKDVAEESWYYDDIAIAKNQGYFNGIYNDTAGPDSSLKREEAVTMLCRALKIEGVSGEDFTFKDSRDFSSWSRDYINAVTVKGLVNGYADGTFRASSHMTRGEMAKVLSDVAGEIVNEEGSNNIGYANKNVSVVQTGANLQNTIVPGDIYITAGLGTGYTELKNLTVRGDLIISGVGNAEDGQMGVLLTDCDIKHLVIDAGGKRILSVKADGGSVIEKTTVKSNAFLEESNSKGIAFKDVILNGAKGTSLSLSGDFEYVNVSAQDNKFSLDKGMVEVLTVDEEAVKGAIYIEDRAVVGTLFCDTATTMTGKGKIEDLQVNAADCNIAVLPDRIYIRPGVTATIAGKKMTNADGEANNAPPQFINGYPRYSDLQATGIKLLAKVNKPGKVYWAVKNIDVVNAGISEEDILNPDKRYVVKSGTQNVTANTEITINVSGLTAGTNYDYYMMFADSQNNRTNIEHEMFKTLDNVAPRFLNSTPKPQDIRADSVDVVLMPSEDTTLYWAVYAERSVPPTAEALSELKLSGALGKGSVSGLEVNDMRTVVIKGTEGRVLSENTRYDAYFVLRDKSDNLSPLSKLTITTGDQTPPKFMDGYPWAEPGAATSVKIRSMADEDATLYWAVYDFDSKFPPVDSLEGLTEAEIRELKVRAVTTGQRSVKSGKTTVRKGVESTLTATGLKKATPYDMYFLLMDKSGNISNIAALKGVKTLDTEAPKAIMEFDKVIDGSPLITSEISVVFNEIVYYNGSELSAKKRLSEYNGKTDEEKAAKEEVLKNIFGLHDLLSVTKPDYIKEDEMNFKEATIVEKEGQTRVNFPHTCFGGGVGLNSGGKYQFEVSNICDSENNSMSQRTLLNSFRVAPPQVYFAKYNGADVLADNELGFDITTGESINSNKFFDCILMSNSLITFDIYIDNSTEKYNTSTLRLEAGQGRSITNMMNGGSYEPFKNLTGHSYKIKILSYKGIPVSEMSSWDGKIELSAMGVVGEPSDLTNLSTSLLNKDNPETIVKNDSNVLIVTNPEKFSTARTYADTANPTCEVQYVKYDTAVNLIVMANKPATFYYVIVPLKDLIKEGMDGTDPTHYKNPPSVDQVMAGKPAYLTSKTGNIKLADGQVEYEQLVEGLKADTKYKCFYVLKGLGVDGLEVKNAQTDASHYEFQTLPPTVPVVTDLKPSGISNETTVEMIGTANTDAKVYWVMYAAGKYHCVSEAGHENDPSALTVEQVMELQNSDGTVVDSGSFNVNLSSDINDAKDDIQFKFTTKNMEPTKTYDLFMVLESEYSGIKSEKVFYYKNLISRDEVPPYVTDKTTTINSVKTVTENEIKHTIFDGETAVTFSEPLYFKNALSGANVKPLTTEVLTGIESPRVWLNVPDDSILTAGGDVKLKIRTTATDDADNGKYPITGFRLNFEGVRNGTQINIDGYIYDRTGWYAGQFIMKFVQDNDDPLKSYFEAYFKKN